MSSPLFLMAEYYYAISKSSRAGQKGVKISVEIATRQYCKSIGSAVAAANLLRQQLIDAGIEFIDPGNDEAGISYGESIRDKNAMRVNMLIDIPDMTPEQVRKALEESVFYDNQDGRFDS
ncbi:MAG: hypothetical protein IPP97_11205 [Candidatus Obscuribacter sp.]|nr:hypothetical protein [Candidatus Obscuribacter sp.]MBP7578342.1 hypothetical protein [Candidatus Obscuribacter sp.]